MNISGLRAYRLRLPVFVAPMFLVSGSDLVVAACAAGVVGTYPTANSRDSEQLRQCLQDITQRLRQIDPPNMPLWAVNLNTHSSNTRLQDDLAAVAEFKPPVVITALGSPRPAVDTVHGYGGIVIGDVTNLKLARKAIDCGVDGLACVCTGSGGHTGFMSPFAFVSAVREMFDGIVIVGGAISDGWGLAGAIASGADFAYMGTRFIASEESLAAGRHKDLVVNCTAEDLVVSDAITGASVSWLGPSLPDQGIGAGSAKDATPQIDHDSNAAPKKRWKEIFSAGQGLGATKGIEPVGEIVESLAREWASATERMKKRAIERKFYEIS